MRLPRIAFEDVRGWDNPGQPSYAYTQLLDAIEQRIRADPSVNHVVVWEEAIHSLPSRYPQLRARMLLTQGRAFGLIPIIGTQSVQFTDTVAWDEVETVMAFRYADRKSQGILTARRGADASVLSELDAEAHEFAVHRVQMAEWALHGPISPPVFPHRVRSAEVATTAR